MWQKNKIGDLMKNNLILMLLTLITVSCAGKKHQITQYEDIPHEHKTESELKVAYDGKCSMAVCEDHCDLKSNRKNSYEYKGVTYFFSSEEARSKFIKDIDENIKKADAAWKRNLRRLDRR